ncbi:barstar family protein [Microbacterium sediminis]|uniref:Ribonuclease inhibitor n=1 Tax=Microbacterium sediminis TaxID=904291 RepID=A0A1B9NG03_9MICO|nr:barstar family protein [Microbacterium sediminis]OCG75528.1 ribonuclease inhibitor [Microbacterium sediminis]QBR73923.1 ribonuclease inhibitor [Microbacterium sediminis]
MTPARVIEIDGSAVRDIASLYAELDRALMPGVDWRLGESLDALNDALSGGYGAIEGREPVTLRWRDFAASEAALGVAATRDWLRAKLARPELFDAARFSAELAELEAGRGRTYLDRVLEVIAEHPNITLVRA